MTNLIIKDMNSTRHVSAQVCIEWGTHYYIDGQFIPAEFVMLISKQIDLC